MNPQLSRPVNHLGELLIVVFAQWDRQLRVFVSLLHHPVTCYKIDITIVQLLFHCRYLIRSYQKHVIVGKGVVINQT